MVASIKLPVMKISVFKIFLLLFFTVNIRAIAQEFPHLLVSNPEKASVLSKIEKYSWAEKIYKDIFDNVSPYVERHVTDPQWILSRYLMNRIPGKRYTRVYSDNGGMRTVRSEGDAPVPTVRVSPHIRGPVTISGAGYSMPEIEELVPYDTASLMHLTNQETGKKEWIDPQAYVGDINGNINDLALDAAIIFWLKSDKKYAKFAADILDQWARGAYYQEPITGPCRTGFLDMQTLGDAAHRSLILAFDFVRTYMQDNGYDLKYYETVFEKFASTLAFRGFWNNNWYAAESSTMVFAALSLDNKNKRDYYLQFFLERDTINGSCGQLALPSTVSKWLTPDGHWKEPGGYHNYPVSNLLVSSLALEKNWYDIFRKFPALFKASYAMLKYSFPNLTVSAFGDTGRASQSPESLEIGLIDAIKYNQPELPEMLASMKKLIEGGRYKRENSGYLGLLCFIPEIPAVTSDYSWPRSGTLEFARYFLQRNGTDPQTGLMFGVQGASYNHNHCNGMAMELYGAGEVMGIDAGAGPTYEHPLHVNYYSQWAAHNTVTAAGFSSSVPFSGSAGQKNIGQIELAAMEPSADSKAVSPLYSFTDTRYRDSSTGTSQMRTMALIRTSVKTGYYIDIFRSDNKISNDYVYHNIGDQVTFLNGKREQIDVVSSRYPLTLKDYPGFRFFSDVKKLENWNENLIALFSIKDGQAKDIYMQVLVPGSNNRVYYQARSLKTKTSGRYAGKTLPLFTMRDTAESKSKPFIAVFEPYRDKDGYNVERISVENRKDGDEFTALTVYNRDNSRQIVFQSLTPGKSFSSEGNTFSGYFGVAGFAGDNITALYLGAGTEISCRGFSLKAGNQKGSASLIVNGKNLQISCNQPVTVTLPLEGVKKVMLETAKVKIRLKTTPGDKSVTFEVPAVTEAAIIVI
jgi:hypothetical protein